MTPRTNARIAGITFLLYIAIAFPSMVLLSRATKGTDIAAKFASIAAHAADVRAVAILTPRSCFAAGTLALLWFATTVPAPAGSGALGSVLLELLDWNATIAATLFAAGSTLFSWLFLRGRLIPRPLAWLGLGASLLVLVVLPARLAGRAGSDRRTDVVPDARVRR